MDILDIIENTLFKVNINREETIGLEFYPYEGKMDYNITQEGEVLETFDTIVGALDYIDSIDMD